MPQKHYENIVQVFVYHFYSGFRKDKAECKLNLFTVKFIYEITFLLLTHSEQLIHQISKSNIQNMVIVWSLR